MRCFGFDYDAEPDIDHEEDRPLKYCDTCECEVRAVEVDEGIGCYEYCGAKGVHHDWVTVCPECGEQV